MHLPTLNAGRRTERPTLYLSVILVAVVGVLAYQLRVDGLFACPATGYSDDRYLAYCQATGFGDYEHGALWFALEPSANESAGKADVMFLGDSRLQFGFSTSATAEWFASRAARPYLFGFSYWETYPFAQRLLRRIEPRARVYVINIDSYFDETESVPAAYVMRDAAARRHYNWKRRWLLFHRWTCTTIPAACGNEFALFRSRQTGAWTATRTKLGPPVSDDDVLDDALVTRYAATARAFIAQLSATQECVILTAVQKPNLKRTTMAAIAATLGLEFVAPRVEGLRTFDGSHLNAESAERWSRAFFEVAGPRISACLGAQ